MWKHVIIDNFLNQEHLDFIKDAYTGKIKAWANNETCEVLQEPNTPAHKITKELIAELHKIYTPKLLEVLKELAPEKVDKYKYTRFIFVKTAKNATYPIHRDTVDKLLSVVVYLKPDQNSGTILYEDGDGNNPMMVEWKPNRAFIFSRSEESWHAFKGDGINDRYTLLINITTEQGSAEFRQKKIKRIEKLKSTGKINSLLKNRRALTKKLVQNVEQKAKIIKQ